MKFVPRSESTRQFIIETTAQLFNTKGFAGTSMSDITEATGLTKGSVYGNFENKEEVALAVFDYNAATRDRIVRTRLEKATTNTDKLLAYASLFSSAENKVFLPGGCPLLNTGTEADDTHEPLRKRVSQELVKWKKEIESIIHAGIMTKEFREDVDAEKWALSMMALVEGGILLARSTRTAVYLDRVLETVKDLVAGIATGRS